MLRLDKSNISNKYLWILLAVVVKFLFFTFFLNQNNQSLLHFTSQLIGHSTGDTNSYLNPIDNLLLNGAYQPDFRMPGYGLIYFFLRLFFNQFLSVNLLIIIQFLLASVSVYYLAMIAYNVFNSNKYFYFTFFIYLFSSYPSYYDSLIISESFAISALIFNIYFLTRYHLTQNKYYLLWAGLFLTWCIFLRAVMFPVLIIQILYLIFFVCKNMNSNIRIKFLHVFLFILPFAMADGAWIIRNNKVNNKFIFLSKSIDYPWADKSFVSLRNFMTSWGGNAYYEPNSEIFWFEYHQKIFNLSDEKINSIKFPNYIYTSQFNCDSLVFVKQLIKKAHDTNITTEQQILCQNLVSKKLNHYSKSIKIEKPFVFYLLAPSKMFVRFVFQSGSHFLFLKPFNQLSFFEKGIKVFYSFIYWIIAVFGLLGGIVCLIKSIKQLHFEIIIAIIPMYIVLIHPVILRLTEERYIIPAYPFLILMVIYFLDFLKKLSS